MCPFDHNIRFDLFAQIDYIKRNCLTFSVTVKPKYQNICFGSMLLYIPNNVHLFFYHVFLKRNLKQLSHISVLPVLAPLRKPVLLNVSAYRCDNHAHKISICELCLELKHWIVLAQSVQFARSLLKLAQIVCNGSCYRRFLSYVQCHYGSCET